MRENLKHRFSNYDKFTVRGIVYIFIACFGLFWEMAISNQYRTFLFVGYGLIIFIGLICIIVLKEKKNEPT